MKGDEDELEKLDGVPGATDGTGQIYAEDPPEGGPDQKAEAGAEGEAAPAKVSGYPHEILGGNG